MLLLRPTLALCTLSAVAAAVPTGETLGIYFDPEATTTSTVVEPLEFFQVYFIAENVPVGITGYEFRVNVPPELFITGTVCHPVGASIDIDSDFAGFIVGCGQCLSGSGPIVVAEITCLALEPAFDLQLTLGPAIPSSFGGMTPGYTECNTHQAIPFDYATPGVATVNVGVGSPYCFCDGSGLLGPCGNDGEEGRGCANSTFASGAQLFAEGAASVSSSTLVLHGDGVTPNQAGLFFQGVNAVNGGLGSIFGDGLRCAGGAVTRLQVRFFDALGAGSTTLDLAVKGGVASGDVRYYQLWYRDPGASPCGTEFNTSNGLEITWSN